MIIQALLLVGAAGAASISHVNPSIIYGRSASAEILPLQTTPIPPHSRLLPRSPFIELAATALEQGIRIGIQQGVTKSAEVGAEKAAQTAVQQGAKKGGEGLAKQAGKKLGKEGEKKAKEEGKDQAQQNIGQKHQKPFHIPTAEEQKHLDHSPGAAMRRVKDRMTGDRKKYMKARAQILVREFSNKPFVFSPTHHMNMLLQQLAVTPKTTC